MTDERHYTFVIGERMEFDGPALCADVYDCEVIPMGEQERLRVSGAGTLRNAAGREAPVKWCEVVLVEQIEDSPVQMPGRTGAGRVDVTIILGDALGLIATQGLVLRLQDGREVGLVVNRLGDADHPSTFHGSLMLPDQWFRG